MGNAENISPAEWRVIQVLWDLGEASAGDVIEQLDEETGWNHRTIRTLIRRLVEKGVVEQRVDGSRHLYRPAVSRNQCIREEGRTFLKRVFRGDASSLLVHFAREAGLGREKIQQLRRLLDDEPEK